MSTSTRTRPARAGRWVEALCCSDVSRLWTELQRLVVNHPLVRASYSAGLLVEEGDRGSAYLDLTQELFVTLLSKSRFQHYLDAAMTDSEIECEVGQIELTNLLTAELRKRHPESYRLARRISTIIQRSANFRPVDSGAGEDEPHRRLAGRGGRSRAPAWLTASTAGASGAPTSGGGRRRNSKSACI